jgi:hypothetical protein
MMPERRIVEPEEMIFARERLEKTLVISLKRLGTKMNSLAINCQL